MKQRLSMTLSHVNKIWKLVLLVTLIACNDKYPKNASQKIVASIDVTSQAVPLSVSVQEQIIDQTESITVQPASINIYRYELK